MKKNTKFLLIFSVICSLFILSCKTNTEKTYTVWTDSESYTAFKSSLGELDDGYFVKIPITNDDWKRSFSDLPNDCKHNWTREEINDWFIGRNFGTKEANAATSWLITEDHGFIASRSGSVVYMIIK